MVNPNPRTLCFVIVQQGLLWIIFKRSMIIELRQGLLISSNKTIEGLGANMQIKNSDGLTMNSYTHFGLRIRSDGDNDAISIFGASNI
ncbi:putative pectate lyase 19, partial [Mucuna pruriens]